VPKGVVGIEAEGKRRKGGARRHGATQATEPAACKQCEFPAAPAAACHPREQAGA
jgi:hypothetical protein